MTNTTNEKVGHTPGPWTLQTVKTVCGVCHKIGPFPWKEGRENHACIYVDYPNHDGRGSYEDELMANAKLIASAPDLLAERDTLKALCAELVLGCRYALSKDKLAELERRCKELGVRRFPFSPEATP